MNALRGAVLACSVWGFLVLPSAAEACAVCTGGENEQSAIAFRYATAVLSLLPILLIGGGVLWLRRRLRQIEAEELAEPVRAPVTR